MRALSVVVFLLFAGSAGLLAITPAAALPGEPTATVTVSPTDVTVDASGVNAVDTVFLVNVSASNQFGIFNPHTVWVNITLSVDRGWAVNPAIQNLTFELDAQGSDEQSIPVTVTVPPGASATDAAVFSARFEASNDMPFSQGQSGNRTAQIHIRQVFSTGASFTNGMNFATAYQGEDATYNITVQNNGNGDAEYDAQVLNTQDLRPNDITLDHTEAAIVPEGGNAVVRVVLSALPAAIPGTYQVQIRVFATGAGETPPPGSYADVTGTLTVKTAPTPPNNGNNTTNPPPNNGNNTTVPGGNNPPPSGNFIDDFIGGITSPTGLIITVVVVAMVLILTGVAVVTRKKKRRRQAALERAREKRRRAMGLSPTPTASSPPKPGMRPVRRQPSSPPMRPAAQDLKRRGST